MSRKKSKKGAAQCGPRPASISRFCEQCHVVFRATRQDARYCGASCRKRASRASAQAPPPPPPPRSVRRVGAWEKLILAIGGQK